jgi:hypothetical protein
MDEQLTYGEQLFVDWAPDESVWTPWAKPVLFNSPALSKKGLFSPSAVEGIPELETFANPTGRVVIVDLPGVNSVRAAVTLAGLGYRPVPLYNGCEGPSAVIPVRELMDAVEGATAQIKDRGLSFNSPPAFLLDSRRMSGFPAFGNFDNRWLIFPQDFPSGNLLLSKGFSEVVLVSLPDGAVQKDLAHVLLRWKESGLAVKFFSFATQDALPLNVPRSAQYKLFFYRALAKLGLHPNSAGGFGDVIATPSETSHGGYG